MLSHTDTTLLDRYWTRVNASVDDSREIIEAVCADAKVLESPWPDTTATATAGPAASRTEDGAPRTTASGDTPPPQELAQVDRALARAQRVQQRTANAATASAGRGTKAKGGKGPGASASASAKSKPHTNDRGKHTVMVAAGVSAAVSGNRSTARGLRGTNPAAGGRAKQPARSKPPSSQGKGSGVDGGPPRSRGKASHGNAASGRGRHAHPPQLSQERGSGAGSSQDDVDVDAHERGKNRGGAGPASPAVHTFSLKEGRAKGTIRLPSKLRKGAAQLQVPYI